MKKYLAMVLCLAMLVTSAFGPFDFSVVKAEAADTTTFQADKVLSSPNLQKPISADTWGEPTLSINKDSYNTGLTKYNADPEEITADLYFRWDAEYLYIGVKSPDADVTGYPENYQGDGLQFKLQAGDSITSEAVDICLTWGKSGFDATVGGESFEVRGSGENVAALKSNTKFNIVNADGSLSMMLAIPHSDMGYSSEEVKAGAKYAMTMLRISGQGGESASEAQAYGGWLEWGTYWDVSHGLHNANCVSSNTIVLDEKEIEAPNVVKANKTLGAVSIDKPISAATWGEPTLSINKDSYNTGLTKYNAEPEDVTADLYFRWDAEYLYIGVKSPDADVTGYTGNYQGDGLQFKLQAGDSITSEAVDICLTWGKSGFDATVGGESFEVRGSGENVAALKSNTKFNIVNADGSLSMMLAIPHSDMGYSADEVKAGAKYAMTMLRISGQGGEGASEAQAYSGWLEWGTYWDVSHDLHNANCVSSNTIVLDEKEIEAPNVVKAGSVLGSPVMSSPITSDTWGEPTLSINKDSYNTGLTKYHADPEDITADLYFRWDAEYLYIGVKSPDADVTGTGDYWTGDGIQFKLQAGDAITGEATDICLTWGSGTFGVGGGNADALKKSIQHNILSEDGSLSMMLAIPHSDMGYSADEVKAGAKYAIGLLRISGQGGEGASEAQAYSGWLEWGTYWDVAHDLHNANCVSSNTIVLDEEVVAIATFVKADKVSAAVDTSKPISAETWGEPTLSINKDSYNTGLTKYHADPEDITADLYFRWDAEYLYIGVKSPDADVTGTGDYWTGDGIQFKLQAGDAITSEATDICLTWGSGTFGVGGGNADALKESIQHNILSEDGSLSMMLAIPHSDMGYSADEVKAGAKYAIGLLRISGQGGDSASEAQAYSGWLEWGTYWDVAHDLHNANCVSSNTIVLYEKNSGSSGGDEQFSSLLDVTAAVGGTSAKTGFNEGMKVVHTSAGTYAVYMVRDNVFVNTNGYTAYNEFQLYEIGEDSVTELGLFYTRAGDVDILAGADGAIYVVGGSSSKVIKEATVHCNDKNAENAVLNVWKYTKENGVLNGRTAQKPFESAKGYSYLNTVSSQDGSAIYSFYIADNSLVWFQYDVAAQKWIEGGQSVELSGAVDKSFVFSDENGVSFVYSSGSSVYEVAVGENVSEDKLLDNIGELKDAYVDTDGQLCLLYTSNEKVYLSVDGSAVEVEEMSAEDYGRLIQNTDSALCILAMEKGAPATIRVLSGEGYPVVETIELDSKAVASIAPSIAAPRNGSDLDGTVRMIFPAPYRTSNHWYYGEITLS